jgi:hypothetical protein
MTAQSYFNKYAPILVPTLSHEDAMEIGFKLFSDLAQEFLDTFESYPADKKSDESCNKLLEELNNKWNAVGNMFFEKYGIPMIQVNGFGRIVNSIFDKAEKRKSDGKKN